MFIDDYTGLSDIETAEKWGAMSSATLKKAPAPASWGSNLFFCVLVGGNLFKQGYKTSADAKGVWNDTTPPIQKNVDDAIRNLLDTYGYTGCWTMCKSAKGHYHVHVFIKSPKKVRYNTLRVRFGGMWIEPLRGTYKQAEAYMKKTDQYAEKGEIVLWESGDWSSLESAQGERSDLCALDAVALQPGFSLDEWLLQNVGPDDAMKWSYFRRRYDALIARSLSGRERDVRVVYVSGLSGSGKSHGVSLRTGLKDYIKYDYYSSFPLDGYSGESVLWLDELRPGLVKPSRLFDLLDRHPMPVNIKNGKSFAGWTTVYITTAYPLLGWFESDSTSTEEQKEGYLLLKSQLLRRIHEYYEVDPESHEWIDKTSVLEEAKGIVAYAASQLRTRSGSIERDLLSLAVQLEKDGLAPVVDGLPFPSDTGCPRP